MGVRYQPGNFSSARSGDAMKLLALVLLVLTDVSMEEPLRYPFGPWTNPDDAKVAAKFRHRLEQEGGIDHAIRRVCAHPMSSEIEDDVASNFLVERAAEAYPALLDAMIKKEKASNTEANAYCRGSLEGTVRFGICYGHMGDGGGSEMDAHPLAVARRAGAHQALAKAIAGGGPRADTAMDVLLEAGNWANGRCAGLADVVRTATPVLVKWLGAPRRPLRIPGGVHSTEEKWDQALRAMSFGGADRAIAEKPVRAFLADDATAPLAAVALAGMGVDVAAEVPHLARILDGIVLSDRTRGPKHSQQQLTLLGDTVNALGAIGKSARATLPNIAAFVARVELPGLLSCQGPTEPLVRALVELGPAAQAPILGALRDEGRPIRERLAAVEVLKQMGQSTLEARDQKLVALLQTKARGPVTELERCRAEASLLAAPTPTVTPPPEFMTCLSRYPCGPTKEIYQQTIDRCCRNTAQHRTLDICVGVRDARRGGA